MISLIKKTIIRSSPDFTYRLYHKTLAHLGSIFYGNPSKKMVIVGVTGTKGKTSTANFIWSSLNHSGIKTGIISTANIRIGDKETLNQFHMTMLGRFSTSALLKKMLNANCQICVVEVTSEGIKQGRHSAIEFDYAVFTNLSPEHLPSHNNNFDEYKEAKGELFKSLSLNPKKIISGKKINKIIIANADSEYSEYFLNFPADKKITYGLTKGDIQAKNIFEDSRGVVFVVKDVPYSTPILGVFNVYNILPAIILSKEMKISEKDIQSGIYNLKLIPGRMEIINSGQNFMVIVDYAHEGVSMKALLESANKLKKGPESKIIILLGAEGGGRDKKKRSIMGRLAGTLADYVIVSNVDPYDDDPKGIIDDIAEASIIAGKKLTLNLFKIEDRRSGIAKALSLAKADDIVLITGKGSEQSMVIGNKKIDWDDRKVVQEELKRCYNTNI